MPKFSTNGNQFDSRTTLNRSFEGQVNTCVSVDEKNRFLRRAESVSITLNRDCDAEANTENGLSFLQFVPLLDEFLGFNNAGSSSASWPEADLSFDVFQGDELTNIRTYSFKRILAQSLNISWTDGGHISETFDFIAQKQTINSDEDEITLNCRFRDPK